MERPQDYSVLKSAVTFIVCSETESDFYVHSQHPPLPPFLRAEIPYCLFFWRSLWESSLHHLPSYSHTDHVVFFYVCVCVFCNVNLDFPSQKFKCLRFNTTCLLCLSMNFIPSANLSSYLWSDPRSRRPTSLFFFCFFFFLHLEWLWIWTHAWGLKPSH